jgi:hypothetical protein
MRDLRRYCDLRESPVLAILEAGITITGQYVSGETLPWPEPTALGEKPSAPTKRMARLVLLQPNSLTARQQPLPIACSTVPGWLLSWPRLLTKLICRRSKFFCPD